jgi:hypothetical protein
VRKSRKPEIRYEERDGQLFRVEVLLGYGSPRRRKHRKPRATHEFAEIEQRTKFPFSATINGRPVMVYEDRTEWL